MTRPNLDVRRMAPLLMVAVLALGGLAHLWHHATDPGCDEGRGPAAHPCVACAGMHGGALAAPAIAPAPPAWFHPTEVFCAPFSAPAASPRGAGASRAPPLA